MADALLLRLVYRSFSVGEFCELCAHLLGKPPIRACVGSQLVLLDWGGLQADGPAPVPVTSRMNLGLGRRFWVAFGIKCSCFKMFTDFQDRLLTVCLSSLKEETFFLTAWWGSEQTIGDYLVPIPVLAMMSGGDLGVTVLRSGPYVVPEGIALLRSVEGMHALKLLKCKVQFGHDVLWQVPSFSVMKLRFFFLFLPCLCLYRDVTMQCVTTPSMVNPQPDLA